MKPKWDHVAIRLAKACGIVRGWPMVRDLPEHGWPLDDMRTFVKNPPWFVVAASLTIIAWIGLWILLRLALGSSFGSNAEDVSKLLLGLAGLLSAPFLVWRTWIADQQQKTAQETHYTNLLTKAVDQLGAMREEAAEDDKKKTVTNTEHRIGAIYALEKLAIDCEQLHWPIMELLSAYVRKNAKMSNLATEEEIHAIYLVKDKLRRGDSEELKNRKATLPSPSADVLAALTVIGRRSDKQRNWEQLRYTWAEENEQRAFYLDLTACQLTKGDMNTLHFERASFRSSRLEQASLKSACFEGARLDEARLEGAVLNEAHLEGASLDGAHLGCASLDGAHLERADLYKADLKGARLCNAHLEDVNLSKATLEGANLSGVRLERAGLYEAHLKGANLKRANLSKAHLDSANLSEAQLEGASLYEAHLEGAWLQSATGLTQGQLDQTFGDEDTVLPEGLTRPENERWSPAPSRPI